MDKGDQKGFFRLLDIWKLDSSLLATACLALPLMSKQDLTILLHIIKAAKKLVGERFSKEMIMEKWKGVCTNTLINITEKTLYLQYG